MTKLSWVQTALAIANSMIGTVLLVLPQYFLNIGLATCLVILLPITLSMAYTVYLWSLHLSQDDSDIMETVRRVLGTKIYYMFSAVSGLALLLLTCVVFLLITSVGYTMLVRLLDVVSFQAFPYSHSTTGTDFTQFSIQYFGLITLIVYGFMINLKDLSFVFKMSKIASICLGLYLCMIIVFFGENLASGRVESSKIKYWALNINQWIQGLSVMSFAVVAHPSVSPFLKSNRNYSDNTKSIALSHFGVMMLYVLVGVFGCIGLINRNATDGSSIISYFNDSIGIFLGLGIPSIIYLMCVFPIYPHVSRNQLQKSILRRSQNQPQGNSYASTYFNIYTISLVVIMALMIIVNIDAGIIIGFLGAVMCYMACYLLPLWIDITEIKAELAGKGEKQSLLSSEVGQQTTSIKASQRSKLRIRLIVNWIVLAGGSLVMLAELYYLVGSVI